MAFQHASHFAIGTLNAATYMSPTVIHAPSTSDPMEILHRARAVEATHTSKTASYAPKCHPGTRAKVTSHIVGWAVATGAVPTNESPRSTSVLWLQGPAGGGKTCIMREVAKRLVDEKMAIATYFFSNRLPGLSSEDPFVATVIYQLVLTLPTLKPFIMEPLVSILGRDPGPGVMLVIDGLDECVASERESLLEVLHTLVTSTPFLTIIIASRPEIDIRTTFAREPYRAITHSIRLQDFKEDSEVRLYLRDEFCRIRESHPARASIPISWPLGEILETLVLKASGNYILPSTVIKHVDNPRRSPVQLLQEVMHCFGAPNPATPTRNPLSPLDALCDMILHPPEGDVALLKQILHWLNSAPSPPRALHPKTDEARTPWVLDEVLNLDPGTTDIALCDLHSLIGISDSGSVTFHHATLHDFLDNQARSKDLFQTKRETYTDISSACATHLERWSKGPADVRDAHLYAAFLVSHTLDLLLQVEGPSGPEPFPKSLLQLDARLMVKLRFYVDEAMRTGWGEVLRVTTVQSDYFGAQAEPACSSVLARSFKRLSTSAPKLLGFIRGYKGSKRSPEGLIAFESESGLYDEPL